MDRKHYDWMNWEEIEAIVYADSDSPFDILGVHKCHNENLLQVFLPEADSVTAVFENNGKEKELLLEKVDEAGFFAAFFKFAYDSYKLKVTKDNIEKIVYDPYSFNVLIDDKEINIIIKGKSEEAYKFFGSHKCVIDNTEGYSFVVYAPNAKNVSLVGDFNNWNKITNLMQKDDKIQGIYKLFVPNLINGSEYKFNIHNKTNSLMKNDPYSLMMHNGNSVTVDFEYNTKTFESHCPQNEYQIIEIDFADIVNGDYKKNVLNLVKKLKEERYNTVLLLPFSERVSDDVNDIFNPFSVAGSKNISPCLINEFVSNIHKEGFSVLCELPIAYVSACESGLSYFDSSELFENEDYRLNTHKYYNAMLYDYNKAWTKSYLFSYVNFMFAEFDFDGAVLSNAGVMIYHDYHKAPGEYISEEWGNTKNSSGIAFIKLLNKFIHKKFNKATTFASIYAYFDDVTGKSKDSLGFDYCYNTGYTNGIIDYFSSDMYSRKYNTDQFLMFTHYENKDENYVYPFGINEYYKDERNLFDRMPGDEIEKLSNLKCAFVFKHMITGPQIFNLKIEDFDAKDDSLNIKFVTFVNDLRTVYDEKREYLLNFPDDKPFSYRCIENNVISREYFSGNNKYLVVFNFSDVSYKEYKIPVSLAGAYLEKFNSDLSKYGGTGLSNKKEILTVDTINYETQNNLSIKLPALSVLAFSFREFTEEELEDIYQKRKAATIKFVEEGKKDILNNLNKRIDELKNEADIKIRELEKLMEAYDH